MVNRPPFFPQVHRHVFDSSDDQSHAIRVQQDQRRRMNAALIANANTEVLPPLQPQLPSVLLQAVLTFAGETEDGRLVEAVAIPWFEILDLFAKDTRAIYEIDPFKWEEIIAGAYERAGFDEVILTPRKGDFGRDVIATKNGIGSIRIFDQVKAYAEDRPVPANDVRALLGVLSGFQNVSKGVITTTSDFAPGIATDPSIAPFFPHRLELRPRDKLLPWLDELAKKRNP